MKHALSILLLPVLASAALFQGRVLDAYTRRAVPWAEVDVFGLNTSLLADSGGRFAFSTGTATVTLGISRIGYANRSWTGLRPGEPVELFLLPEVISLEGVTVTAFRTPVPLDRSGPVTVIERDQVEESGATNLADVAAGANGALARDNVNLTSVGLRGAGSEHVLVTLEGVPLNSPQNGVIDLSLLPVSAAERVEVVRGGNSALYGASPLGGSVNLVTPDPSGRRARLRAGLGSFGARHVVAGYEDRFGPVGVTGGGQWLGARNDFPWQPDSGPELAMPNADVSSLAGFAKTTCRLGEHRLGLLGLAGQGERGSPGPRNWPSDSARRADQYALGQLDHSWQPSELVRTEARAWWHAAAQRYRDPQAEPETDDTHDLNDRGIQARIVADILPLTRLMAGLEAGSQSLASTTVGGPERSTLAGWVQARAEFAGFALSPALRAETWQQQVPAIDADSRAVLSPKVTLTWSGADWLNAWAGVGRSFRLPTFNDLYWPEDAWSYGNPDLRPEWSTNLDIGLRGHLSPGLAYSLGAYRAALTDLIQWQPDSAFRFRPVNIDSATLAGIEVEFDTDLDRLGFSGWLHWSSARSGDEPLRYRPELTGRVAARLRQPLRFVDLGLDLAAGFSSSRLGDSAFSTEPRTLPGFVLLDAGARAGRDFGPVHAELALGVRNLLDRRYETVSYYPNPGRSWWSELRLGS